VRKSYGGLFRGRSDDAMRMLNFCREFLWDMISEDTGVHRFGLHVWLVVLDHVIYPCQRAAQHGALQVKSRST